MPDPISFAHPSLRLPLSLPPTVRRSDTIGRNDPCWCLSGKKFKACHLGREHMPVFHVHQLAEALRKELGRRYCSFGNEAGDPCGAAIISSHTVQKEGGLRAIARDSKVYSMLPTLAGLAKNDGKLVPRLVGINDASVFPGFCSSHDNNLFKPIEAKTCTIGPRESLLFAYRAASYEAFMKRAQRVIAPLYLRLDEGQPVHLHENFQLMARAFAFNASAGEEGTRSRKIEYDRRVRENDLAGFHFSWTRFDGILPIACCGTFLPDNDFVGNRLQRIGHGQGPYEQIALNITAYEDQSVIVMGWTGASDGPAARFAASYADLKDNQKAGAAVRLAIEYLENSFVEPVWWESLTTSDRNRVLRRNASTFGPRSPADTRAVLDTVPKFSVIGVMDGGHTAAHGSDKTAQQGRAMDSD